jgi:type I restriction enzyme, S subunit
VSANFVQLGSVAEFINGAAFKPEDWNGSGPRIIRIQNLTDPSKPYNRTDRTVDDKLRVRPGELLVSWSATLGVFEWMGPDDGVLNQHIFRVVPDKNKVAKSYLRHALEGALVEMQRHLHGATMQHVNRGEFLATKLFLPALAEQRRIAEVLDRAEALRAKRRTALARLDALTQSMFLDLFGDTAANSKGWPARALKDECDQINDCPHSTPAWTEEGVICLRTSNLTEGGWDWSDTRYVSEETYNERSKRGHVEPGDIVLSREGTVGIAAIVTPGMRVCMGQRLVQVRPASCVLLPDFLLRHLLYVLSPARIGQVMVGSTSQHLNVKELKALRLPLPPLALQRDFASRIAIVDKLRAAHRASLDEMEAMFAALQFRAFRGSL